ncbi:MAG: hypothetical protein FWF84_03715 [Kiritimatiellaeota bacterium]|nr:hypothetical protein [Kiritimatiellota bacterium]
MKKMMAMMMAMAATGAWAVDFSEGKVVVTDHLKVGYAREFVSVPFTAAEGACVEGKFGLKDTPSQFSDVVYWDAEKKTIKSATLTFVVEDLQPLESREYVVAAASPPPSINPFNDSGDAAATFFEIGNEAVGVRIARGSGTLKEAVAFSELPTVMTAMRFGTMWEEGGSSFTGDAKVVAWNTTVEGSGPVFARVRTEWVFEEGDTARLTATIFAGDNAIRWSVEGSETRLGNAIRLDFPKMPGVKQAKVMPGFGMWAQNKEPKFVDVTPGEAPFGNLVQETSIRALSGPYYAKIFLEGEGQTLYVASENPDDEWVTPARRISYGGHENILHGTMGKATDFWRRTALAMRYGEDGVFSVEIPLTQGNRHWVVGVGGEPKIGSELNRVSKMVLAWDTPSEWPLHPWAFATRSEVDAAWAKAESDAELMARLKRGVYYNGGSPMFAAPLDTEWTPEQVARHTARMWERLGQWGDFDLLRQLDGVLGAYDAYVDSGMLSAEERKLVRARTAYLAYTIASSKAWSLERGQTSGNPNMSVNYSMSVGNAAAVLRDHPMAAEWADYGAKWLDHWLTHNVGENGEWISEGAGYGMVALPAIVSHAIAAKNAGGVDFTAHPGLHAVLEYHAKHNTPIDPYRFDGKRVRGAFGRGLAAETSPIFPFAAKFIKDANPELSAKLMWHWNRGDRKWELGDACMGGFEAYYVDFDLPERAPEWKSETFPNLGTLMRHAYDRPWESYVHQLHPTENLDIWAPQFGALTLWYGRGVPVSTVFPGDFGYAMHHELLSNSPRLARNWGAEGDSKLPFGRFSRGTVKDFAPQPTMEYLRVQYASGGREGHDWWPTPDIPAMPRVTPASGDTFAWTRQLLFVKDPDQETNAPAWLLFRDTMEVGEPTQWQLWTLSERIGLPMGGEALAAFLAEKPGETALPAAELPTGDRYTAYGQFGMDVEYFIASPSATPRHTARYGSAMPPSSGSTLPHYQDSLMLQLPADGAYVVAAFPSPRAETPPTFTQHAEGRIVEIDHATGKDIAFLSFDPTTAEGAGAVFNGTAGSVQERNNRITLTLGAPGTITYKGHTLASETPATQTFSP